jgi:hypothetical protein
MNFQAILSGADSNPRPAIPGRGDLKIGFDWLCFFPLRGSLFCHNLLSYKTLRHIAPPANWLCFFNFHYAVRSTWNSVRNKLALFFQLGSI